MDGFEMDCTLYIQLNDGRKAKDFSKWTTGETKKKYEKVTQQQNKHMNEIISQMNSHTKWKPILKTDSSDWEILLQMFDFFCMYVVIGASISYFRRPTEQSNEEGRRGEMEEWKKKE